MHRAPGLWRSILALCLISLATACAGLQMDSAGPQAQSVIVPAGQATLAALQAEQVELQNTQISLQDEQIVVQSTQVAQMQKQVRTAEPAVVAPSETLSPALPTVTAPVTEVVATPSAAQQDLWVRSAKILLYESMSGRGQVRYVKQALDQAGYAYVDVGSAKGWFKTHLLGGEDWDLVVAAAEYRTPLEGEYFQYISDHLENGSAAILELWDLDASAGGQIAPLLQHCGVSFQSDWYMPGARSLWWLIPDHPILHQPNEVGSALAHYQTFWAEDAGDLLQRRPDAGEDTQLLAGSLAGQVDDHATLVSCYDGRMVLQTFSSHEYRYQEMLRLWQNMIDYTLRNHFRLVAPAPLATPDGAADGTREECQGRVDAQLTRPAERTTALFEHHADGEYLILRVRLQNQLERAVQMWDEDYVLSVQVDGQTQQLRPDGAATTYLYNANSVHWYQDRIPPGGGWETLLAFDVDPRLQDWSLLISPGLEVGEPLCETRLVAGE